MENKATREAGYYFVTFNGQRRPAHWNGELWHVWGNMGDWSDSHCENPVKAVEQIDPTPITRTQPAEMSSAESILNNFGIGEQILPYFGSPRIVISKERLIEMLDFVQSLPISRGQENGQSLPGIFTKEEKHECEKCGGRLALVSGYFIFQPDPEPYQAGVEEEAETELYQTYISGHVCDKCNHVQGFTLER